MQSEPGASRSTWMDTTRSTIGQDLAGDLTTDVCVIGAGVSGVSVARALLREGHTVVILDDGPVGCGETSRSTAHITTAIDGGYARLEHLHGEASAMLAQQSHAAAIEWIDEIVREDHIDCDFRRLDGFLFAASGAPPEELTREFDAATRAGARVVALDRPPFPAPGFEACLHFSDQAQLHPLRYLDGLSAAFVRLGGRIFHNAHARAVHDGEPVRIEVEGGRVVTARSVVIATHSPFTTLVAMHTKQAAYRTFVVAADCPRGSVPQALIWDTADPYHYVRIDPARAEDECDLLLVGGEDHKTGQADDADERYARLELWMREHFPMAGPIRRRWSGQLLETLDHLAYIGLQPGAKHVYLITGDSGMGFTHAAIAAMLLPDALAGREHKWAKLYAADRKPLRAANDYLRENLNVAAQFADLVKPGEAASVDDIPRESGAIVRRGLHLVAAYRDGDGTLHERSAVCTHLGCVVHWNSTESSWDCPCHGSRFDTAGCVLAGPATKPLATAHPSESEPVVVANENASSG
ncbi:MAG: FAD-dependent oxidoreductase [Planctomycetes bacterium]|nr:FAD-dependent oxidoreductase [Planctomycetota bacterium]